MRSRVTDIPLLVDALLERLCQQNGLETRPAITTDALQVLCTYRFPGNVRELENILERAITLYDGSEITTSDLQLGGNGSDVGNRLASASTESKYSGADDTLNLEGKIDQIQRQEIEEALQKTRYNKTQAAKLLGLSFRQLRYRIKKLGIE